MCWLSTIKLFETIWPEMNQLQGSPTFTISTFELLQNIKKHAWFTEWYRLCLCRDMPIEEDVKKENQHLYSICNRHLVFVPAPKFICWNSSPYWDGIRRRGLWEMICKDDSRGQSPYDGVRVLMRRGRDQGTHSLYHVRPRWPSCRGKRGWLSAEYPYHDLGHPSLQNSEK